jgi:hypothetical protein
MACRARLRTTDHWLSGLIGCDEWERQVVEQLISTDVPESLIRVEINMTTRSTEGEIKRRWIAGSQTTLPSVIAEVLSDEFIHLLLADQCQSILTSLPESLSELKLSLTSTTNESPTN